MQKNEFPQKVLMLRGALGLTQEDFAAKIKVSKRSVSAWENGGLFPKKTVRINMAVICGFPVTEFLLDEEKIQGSATSSTDDNDFIERFKNIVGAPNVFKEY